jgi:hypothetical protein
MISRLQPEASSVDHTVLISKIPVRHIIQVLSQCTLGANKRSNIRTVLAHEVTEAVRPTAYAEVVRFGGHVCHSRGRLQALWNMRETELKRMWKFPSHKALRVFASYSQCHVLTSKPKVSKGAANLQLMHLRFVCQMMIICE